MHTDIHFEQNKEARGRGLVDQALEGDVFVIRKSLQQFDLMQPFIDAALEGIRKSVGVEAAQRAEAEGFEHIHKWVAAEDIPMMTEAVYDAIRPLAPEFIRGYAHQAFPDSADLYYEETPNVRFHIPYDLAAAQDEAYRDFAKDYGEGKISAHGPHRDSWLDCPSNGVNLWFAIGPVKHGNGLTLYKEDNDRTFKYKHAGDIAEGIKLHKPLTFDLDPGDGVLFHFDCLHGSEVNRTDETRFVISFRLTFGKPHFPNRHFHRYVKANIAASPFSFAAHIPAMMQGSYPRSLVQRISEKLSPPPGADEPAAPPEMIGVETDGKFRVQLKDVPVGTVRGVSHALCVARMSEDEVISVTRRCPHAGADLANGWVDGAAIVCPWHNLPYDAKTGRSPCETVPVLKRVHCEIKGDEIIIDPKQRITES